MGCEQEYGCERNFLTAEEKAERLEQYARWLELEKKGVEEAVAKLRKGN